MSPPLCFHILQFLITFVVIYDETTASSSCTANEWNQCSKNVLEFKANPEFPLSLTAEEITTFCEKIFPETLECKKEFAQECMNDSGQADFINASALAQWYHKMACTRNESRNFTSCTLNEWNHCKDQVKKVASTPVHYPKSSDLSLERDTSFCIILKESLDCEQRFADKCFTDSYKIRFEQINKGQVNDMLGFCNGGLREDCDREQKKCESEGVYVNKAKIMSVTTGDELQEVCNSANNYKNCMKDYLQKCSNHEEPQRRNEMTLLLRLVGRVCTPGDPFIPRFLKFTTCLSMVTTEYNVCVVNMLQQIKKFQSSNHDTPDIQELCCNFEQYFHCVRAVFQSKCDKSVADTAEEIYKKIIFGDFEPTCSAYNTIQCSSMHNATALTTPDTEESRECQYSQRCLEDLEYMNRHRIRIAVTENELTTACKFTKEGLACIKNYLDKCNKEPITLNTNKELAQAQDLVDAVCEPGDPFRKRFLEYTTCSPNFAGELEPCNDEFQNKLKIIPDLPVNERLGQLCCDLESFLHCARTAMERKCGKDVAATGIKVMEIHGFNKSESYCSRLSYNPKCPSSLSRTVSSTTSQPTTVFKRSSSATTKSRTKPVLNTSAPLKSATVPVSSFQSFYIFAYLFINTLCY